jgi:hypothetical protein
MNYYDHLKANLNVALKALILFVFHFIHAFIPCKYTSHEYWGITLTKK